jgi:hypothetical protein
LGWRGGEGKGTIVGAERGRAAVGFWKKEESRSETPLGEKRGMKGHFFFRRSATC